MSHVTARYHTTDLAEQLTLLRQGELAELRCPSAFRQRKTEIASRKVRRQGLEERFSQSAGPTQPKLPGV